VLLSKETKDVDYGLASHEDETADAAAPAPAGR
jgi:hypothetical protein